MEKLHLRKDALYLAELRMNSPRAGFLLLIYFFRIYKMKTVNHQV